MCTGTGMCRRRVTFTFTCTGTVHLSSILQVAWIVQLATVAGLDHLLDPLL